MSKNKKRSFRGLARPLARAVSNLVRIGGKVLFAPAASTSVVEQALTPVNTTLFGDRLTYLADCFQLFRFVKMEILLHPANEVLTVAYDLVNDAVATPTTTAELLELGTSTMVAAYEHVSRPLKLFRSNMSSVPVWFALRTEDNDNRVSRQGNIFYVNGGNSAANLMEISYIIEFKQPTSIYAGIRKKTLPSVESKVDEDEEFETLIVKRKSK